MSGCGTSAATASGRLSASAGGGGLGAATAVGRRSASTGDSGASVATAAARLSASTGESVATAAARPSASMGGGGASAASAAAQQSVSTCDSGPSAVTAAILCVRSRPVLGKISHSPERRDALIAFEYQHHLPFRGCGLGLETAHAFADFALPTPWGYVLLEVDEEQHKAYDPSCDVRRDFDMAASVALGSGHKLLRYNPDAFKIAGVTRRTTKKERHAADPPAGRAVGARAGGAFHPPLSLLRPGRGEQRSALCGGALVRARARRVPLRMIVPRD